MFFVSQLSMKTEIYFYFDKPNGSTAF